jgi:hypothetical protein
VTQRGLRTIRETAIVPLAWYPNPLLERVSKIDSASRQVLTCKAGCRLSFCHEEAAEAIDG